MPHFDLPRDKVDDYMEKASKRKALIIDLRGNGGGAEETLLRLLGYFTDVDLKLGDIVRRKETKPMIAKSMGSRAFKGKLIVLIDSESGSASEVFARTIQLEKRGTILGDRSAGAVMRSIFYPKQVGIDTRVVFYGVNITDADLILSDGKSLEKVGVIPDENIVPTMSQIQNAQDPVLSRAAAIAGVEITPEKAGSLFPIIWK
jgi:carboxyl-terminal processing protease